MKGGDKPYAVLQEALHEMARRIARFAAGASAASGVAARSEVLALR
jgi:hypothetical protein